MHLIDAFSTSQRLSIGDEEAKPTKTSPKTYTACKNATGNTVQHRRGAWHACCRPQAQAKGRTSCSGNTESKWTVKAETEQTERQGRAPIPYPFSSILSAHIQAIPLCFVPSPRHIDPSTNIPNLARLPNVLGPPLHPHFSPAETRHRLYLLHTYVSLCVLLTAFVTRTHSTSEAGMA